MFFRNESLGIFVIRKVLLVISISQLCGKMPAKLLRGTCPLLLTGIITDEAEPPIEPVGEYHSLIIGPGTEMNSPSFIVSAEDTNLVYDGKKHLFLIGNATYQDMFSEEWRWTRYCYKIELFRDASKPLQWPNLSWMKWIVVGPYNGTDDEDSRGQRPCPKAPTPHSTTRG